MRKPTPLLQCQLIFNATTGNYQNTLCNYWSKWIIRLKLIWCKGSQLIERGIYELTGLKSKSKNTGRLAI
jgi:hypothetical protein